MGVATDILNTTRNMPTPYRDQLCTFSVLLKLSSNSPMSQSSHRVALTISSSSLVLTRTNRVFLKGACGTAHQLWRLSRQLWGVGRFKGPES